MEKELLPLEPPDRRPEEVTTTSDSSSTPPAGGPRQQHPRYPVFDPHASQGLQVSRRVSDAQSGELCLDGAAPRGLPPTPLPLHPPALRASALALPAFPPFSPSCCTQRGGAHPGPGSARAGRSPASGPRGPSSPQPAGSARETQGARAQEA